MTLLNQGLQRHRALIDADTDQGKLGTGGTASDQSDTGLETGVGATLLDVTNTAVDKQFTSAYNLDSTVGIGNTYKEFILVDSLGNATSRIVFTGIAHTADTEIDIKMRTFIKPV